MADTTLEKIETLPYEEKTLILSENVEIKIRVPKTLYLDAEGNEIIDVNELCELNEK